MKVWQKNLILIGLVILLAAFPLWYCRGAEFGGASPSLSRPAGRWSPSSSLSRPPSAPASSASCWAG